MSTRVLLGDNITTNTQILTITIQIIGGLKDLIFLLALSLLRGAELFKGCVESLMGRMETPKGSAE